MDIHFVYPIEMKVEETVVFQSGNSLAIRLKGACRLPKGARVRQYREGNRIILELVNTWPQSFVESLNSWDEEIPRPEDEDSQRDPFE
jgi:virulence-associated protein VagC